MPGSRCINGRAAQYGFLRIVAAGARPHTADAPAFTPILAVHGRQANRAPLFCRSASLDLLTPRVERKGRLGWVALGDVVAAPELAAHRRTGAVTTWWHARTDISLAPVADTGGPHIPGQWRLSAARPDPADIVASVNQQTSRLNGVIWRRGARRYGSLRLGSTERAAPRRKVSRNVRLR